MLKNKNNSYRGVLKGIIKTISPGLNLIGIKVKRMKGNVMKYDVDHFKHATVTVKSGAAQNLTALITSSTAYNNETSILGLELTLDSNINNLDTGDKVFIKWNLKDLPLNLFPSDFYGCGFAAETPNTDIFPAGLVATFHGCNLININLPAGCTVQDWSEKGIQSVHEQVLLQNDMEYWILDGSLNPVKPIREDLYIEKGISTDPADIPVSPLTDSILFTV